jgi:hypothetical protein
MPEGPPPPQSKPPGMFASLIVFSSDIAFRLEPEQALLPPLPPTIPSNLPSTLPLRQVSMPPLPPGFPGTFVLPPPPPFPHPVSNPLPPTLPPQIPQLLPGSLPRRQQSTSAMQDPLSSIPHQTFQAHRSARHLPNPATDSLSPSGPLHSSNTHVPGATISAAPELRDLKKEATSFMPASLKRKKAGTGTSSKVNAAPLLSSGTEDATETLADPIRPDLLGTLKNRFGPAPPANKRGEKVTAEAVKGKDDYEKFVEEMGDILGPRSK